MKSTIQLLGYPTVSWKPPNQPVIWGSPWRWHDGTSLASCFNFFSWFLAFLIRRRLSRDFCDVHKVDMIYLHIYIYIHIYVCVLLYIIYTYTYIPYEMAQWCFLAMYFQLESSSAPNLLRASDPVDLWLVHVTADVTRTDGCAVGYPLVKWWFNGG